tara:strand:- start:1164 stop:1544 length:381 start_codon:yes stop_codon:yes gene_type:complete
MKKFLKISEVSKLLNLIDSKSKKPLNHIIRFWEKEFKKINPTIINKRRYYTEKQIEIIRLIKFLLKDKGMTIKGVKNILKNNINSLDDYDLNSLKTDYQKKRVELKVEKVLNKIKVLKNYGKKNTH